MWNSETLEPYENRQHAGVVLAHELEHYRGRDLVVLGLPRGGVPVAHEVARALDAPLDVFIVRKLGVPGHRELAMGALASGGVRVLNRDIVDAYGLSEIAIDEVVREEAAELERRERTYREGGPAIEVGGRIVLLIDDGLATGASMKAAVEAVRLRGPARIVVAVPVGSPDTCREFADIADEIICARTPEYFSAVGQWYRDFSQTSDEEVRQLLHDDAAEARGARTTGI